MITSFSSFLYQPTKTYRYESRLRYPSYLPPTSHLPLDLAYLPDFQFNEEQLMNELAQLTADSTTTSTPDADNNPPPPSYYDHMKQKQW